MNSRFLVLVVMVAFALACGGGSSVDMDAGGMGAIGGGGSIPSAFDDVADAIKDGKIIITTDAPTPTATLSYPASTDVAALGGKIRDAAKAKGWEEVSYSDAMGMVGGSFKKDGKQLVVGISAMGDVMVSLSISTM